MNMDFQIQKIVDLNDRSVQIVSPNSKQMDISRNITPVRSSHLLRQENRSFSFSAHLFNSEFQSSRHHSPTPNYHKATDFSGLKDKRVLLKRSNMTTSTPVKEESKENINYNKPKSPQNLEKISPKKPRKRKSEEHIPIQKEIPKKEPKKTELKRHKSFSMILNQIKKIRTRKKKPNEKQQKPKRILEKEIPKKQEITKKILEPISAKKTKPRRSRKIKKTKFQKQKENKKKETDHDQKEEIEQKKRFLVHKFDEVLHSKFALGYFRSFLKSEFSDENVDFWATVQVFKKLNKKSDISKMAQLIYNKYIKEGSQREVNIDYLDRRKVESVFLKGDYDKALFESSQDKIYRLMETDCFPRFLKSQFCNDLIIYILQNQKDIQEEWCKNF